MSSEWDARVYLIEYTHRWPYALLAFLVGCLIGFAFSYIFPTPQSAEATLFVSYNTDAELRNPDDYKNYQMGQLNALIVAPDVLEETHNRLKQIDPYWDEVTFDELNQSLKLYWRNTGTWRLAAENASTEHAVQALETWMEVFLEAYRTASGAATDVLSLGVLFEEVNSEQAQAKIRYGELTAVREGIYAWQSEISAMPEDQTLDTTTRWRLEALVARGSSFDPAWAALLTSFPSPEAAASDYLNWLELALASLDVAIDTIDGKITLTEPELSDLQNRYEEAASASRGLSSLVYVERGSNLPPTTTPLRSSGAAALVGGLIGLIVWMVVGLVRMSLKAGR